MLAESAAKDVEWSARFAYLGMASAKIGFPGQSRYTLYVSDQALRRLGQ